MWLLTWGSLNSACTFSQLISKAEQFNFIKYTFRIHYQSSMQPSNWYQLYCCFLEWFFFPVMDKKNFYTIFSSLCSNPKQYQVLYVFCFCACWIVQIHILTWAWSSVISLKSVKMSLKLCILVCYQFLKIKSWNYLQLVFLYLQYSV